MNIIAHNIPGMNAQRQLNINTKYKAKSTEKLSSGYRINRAADDAAGLSISEKMRKQIVGLDQGADNAQDGISMVQVAEGAMAEIHDMLDRCIQLSVKAANGTLSESDRKDIQNEIDQIKLEINQTREKTKFNETYVLKGIDTNQTENQKTGGVAIIGDLPSWVNCPQFADKYMSDQYGTDVLCTYTDYAGVVHTDETKSINHSAAYLDFSAYDGSQKNDLIGKGFYSTCCTCDDHYSIEFTNGTSYSRETSGNHYIFKIGIDGTTNASELYDRILAGTNGGYPNRHFTKLAKDGDKLVVYDDRAHDPMGTYFFGGLPTDVTWKGWDNKLWNTHASPTRGKIGPGVARAEEETIITGTSTNPKNISLHVGADSTDDNKIEVLLPDISCRTLGIVKTNVLTKENATKSIDEFGDAIAKVSEDRSRLGAVQNRLEHTIKNLDNVVENTTSAESRIRDTDMAKEMVQLSVSNILEQAGQSMLAQINQNSQSVLSLLS